MTALLRAHSGPLATALAGGVQLWRADLFDILLQDGVTTYNWATWDGPLTANSIAYQTQKPWIERTNWNVANTMEVPSMTVFLRALNDGFAGGAQIKTQIHNGLFDGASLTLSRAFMTSPGSTSALGTVELFGGVVAGLDLTGSTATLTVKGKNNLLDQFAPRNLYQKPCLHGFCDVGCTLSRATFTASYAVGTGPTSSFLPWSGSPPANAALYTNGQITMTSGAAAGQTRTVAAADSTGLTLAYPLYQTPTAADGFTAFQGCSKGFSDGSGQDCTAYANTQHWKGYDQIPPPASAV